MLKRIFTLLISLALLLALYSCKGEDKCDSHKDGDGDGKCDNCSAPVEKEEGEDDKENGEGNNTPEKTTSSVTVKVKLDNGETLSGVKLTLTLGEKSYDLTSDNDGKAVVELPFGEYEVSVDYDTLPEACFSDTYSVTVTKDTTELLVSVIDNTPDGSPEKPFFISDEITSVSIGGGEVLHYNYRGSQNKFVEIENENISIIYNGNIYSAEGGVVRVELIAQFGALTSFSIKNDSNLNIETEMALVSPLGSMENPIVMESSEMSAEITEGSSIYYKWIAEESGVLVVTSKNEVNNISLINEATYAVSALTMGSAGEYIAVSEGDEILVVVSTKDGSSANVTFSVDTYLGTEADPVPIIKDTVDISFGVGASIVFSAEIGNSVTVNDNEATVTMGETYLPDNGKITITLTEPLFTVTNTAEGANGITVKVE